MTFMIIWGHYHRSIKEEQSNWVVEEMDHRQSSSLNANMIQIIKSMTSGIMMRIDWVNLANWRWKSFREQDRNFLIGTVWMTSNSKVIDHWLRFELKMRRSPWSRQLILVPRHRAESEINTLAVSNNKKCAAAGCFCAPPKKNYPLQSSFSAKLVDITSPL